MILEYDIKTGEILNGVSGIELRRGSDNMFDSVSQQYFSDNKGLPRQLKPGHAIKVFRDSVIGLRYLAFLKNERGLPIWKFQFKDGKPIKIVPISGIYPVGWL
jgi:hypothetical protein